MGWDRIKIESIFEAGKSLLAEGDLNGAESCFREMIVFFQVAELEGVALEDAGNQVYEAEMLLEDIREKQAKEYQHD